MLALSITGNAGGLLFFSNSEFTASLPPVGSAYGWTLDYYTDEFGEDDYSQPFISRFIKGTHNNTFDCNLGIRLSDIFGIEFGLIEDMQMVNYSGMRITASFNNSKFNVPYTQRGNSLTVSDSDVVQRLLKCLDTKGVLKLSFYRVDSYDTGQNRVFFINTPTYWSKAYHELMK